MKNLNTRFTRHENPQHPAHLNMKATPLAQW